MTATCTIHFQNGETKVLPLGEKCIELQLPIHMRQSIAVDQTSQGWKMAFTAGLMEGRKWEKIVIEKQP